MWYAVCTVQHAVNEIFQFPFSHAIIAILCYCSIADIQRKRNNTTACWFPNIHVETVYFHVILSLLFIHVSQVVVQIDVSRFNYVGLGLCVCVCEVRAREISLIGIIILFQVIDIADPIRVAISISIIWLRSQKCERTGWEQDNRNSDGLLYPSIHQSWF